MLEDSQSLPVHNIYKRMSLGYLKYFLEKECVDDLHSSVEERESHNLEVEGSKPSVDTFYNFTKMISFLNLLFSIKQFNYFIRHLPKIEQEIFKRLFENVLAPNQLPLFTNITIRTLFQMMFRNEVRFQDLPADVVQDEANSATIMVYNLDELTKLHRKGNKNTIQQKLYNNAFINYENPIAPQQIYSQMDSLRAYLQDLSLVYFKDIELDECVRMEHLYRRVNYTLNGQKFNLRSHIDNSQFWSLIEETFQSEYIQAMHETSNEKPILNSRNLLKMCHLVTDILNSKSCDQSDKDYFLTRISDLHANLRKKLDEHDVLSFDDMLFEEEMELKIIQLELQNSAINCRLSYPDDDQKERLVYMADINKEYFLNVNELKEINLNNRLLLRNISLNINLELNCGQKCICLQNEDDDDIDYFGNADKIDTIQELSNKMISAIQDVQCMQIQLLKSIQELKMKQVADKIEKVYEIEREENRNCKVNKIYFSVTFEHGIEVEKAIFSEEEFVRLNELREESTLTSYLVPMKSCYSYISHNIYTFLKLFSAEFPYDKTINNNQEILRRIKNKISRHKNLGKTEIKQFYFQNFQMCHNCKILCHKDFLRICRKKTKFQSKEDEEEMLENNEDDSLYTEYNKRKNFPKYIFQCEKAFCLYCIKNQFGGKLLNDKGSCPACQKTCHCTTCLREKFLQKLIGLYLHVGGDASNIKNEKQIIESIRSKVTIRRSTRNQNNQEEAEDMSQIQISQSHTEIQDNPLESIIKREKSKGFHLQKIASELHLQIDLDKRVIERENMKLKRLQSQQKSFRQKIKLITTAFNYDYLDKEFNRVREKLQLENRLKEKREEESRIERRLFKERKGIDIKGGKRSRKIRHNEEENCYEYYNEFSLISSEESEFHLREKKKLKKDEQPYYIY